MILCLVIFVLTIASFLWGKISMGLTALLSMVLLVLTGCIDITTALSGFSNSNTIIMACMFIISAGFSKTQMVAKLSRGVAKAAKGSFTRVLTGYIIVTFLIAQIVPSAMAVFSIVFPLALGVCDEMKVSPSKIMFSIGIVAISTVTALPIGAGAVYPAQYNGLLENLGAGAFQFKFWDVGLARLPGVIAVMLYAILLAPKFAPEKPVIETREVKPVGAAGAVKLSPVQEVVGYLVFFGVILGLIVTSLQLIKIPVIGEDGTATLMKLDTCVFPLIGALLMVAFGILKPKEAYVSIGMGGMVLTYVGVLALASGLTNTGTGALIGNAIAWIFIPLGWGNWQSAVATITGLIAKENVVGTFGVLFGGFDEVAENGWQIWANMREVFTPLAAYSFLVFNLLCAPCFAAMGAIKREMNSAKWTLFAIGYQCVFAYAVSLVLYQLGMLFTGHGNLLGSIFAFAIAALILYLLFRPYKESRTLSKPVKI